MIQLGSISFHFYGLILGLAIVLGFHLITLKAKKNNISENDVAKAAIWIIIAGFIGARLWHVVTDWSLYASRLEAIFFVWQGGLSILGAVAGGFLGAFAYSRFYRGIPLSLLLDLSIFGLPFAQAVGRIANFLNQELYGLPTHLPWGIYISPEYRIKGLEAFSYFHPLFAYESLLTFGAGCLIWYLYSKKVPPEWNLGRGILFLAYIEYYAGVRVLLDFLRPDKVVVQGGLGLNQLILILFLCVNGWYLWKKYENGRAVKK